MHCTVTGRASTSSTTIACKLGWEGIETPWVRRDPVKRENIVEQALERPPDIPSDVPSDRLNLTLSRLLCCSDK